MKRRPDVVVKMRNNRIAKYDPDKYHADRIRRMHGVSYDDLMKAQRRRCAICGKRRSDKVGRRLVVDHDHKTGKVRGLLCSNCNNGLGRFKDSLLLLNAALTYLRRAA